MRKQFELLPVWEFRVLLRKYMCLRETSVIYELFFEYILNHYTF